MKLDDNHIHKAIEKLPEVVKTLLIKYGKDLILSGGYLRSIQQNEEIHDLDLFTTSKELALTIANELQSITRKVLKTTDNSYYVKTEPIIQIIHKFVYPTPQELIESFDFTIACAAIWYTDGVIRSLCLPEYYDDLENKNLIFRYPDREDEAMSGILRMIKFAKMGYHIPRQTVSGVVGRAFAKLPLNGIEEDNPPIISETPWGPVIMSLPLERQYANIISDSISDMTGVS